MAEQFRWTAPDDSEIVLPRMNKIKGGMIRRYRKLSDVDMMFSIVEELVDAETLAQIDDLDQGAMNDLFAAWQKDGATVGESSRSST